eukprot:TRINITY_DN11459_c0_g1_i1.p1 TRINITY_DN11459_c0_g1~~TRINITY_DN11459_c0_g1_i1.p1  ORF type:complete len:380 (-),score=36.78 TRINITY_DN11459_c0_g1_i1:56-1195(-)
MIHAAPKWGANLSCAPQYYVGEFYMQQPGIYQLRAQWSYSEFSAFDELQYPAVWNRPKNSQLVQSAVFTCQKQAQNKTTRKLRFAHCTSSLLGGGGRWVIRDNSVVWQLPGCMGHALLPLAARSHLPRGWLHGKRLLFAGDSHTRTVFDRFLNFLVQEAGFRHSHKASHFGPHDDHPAELIDSREPASSPLRLEFIWDPYLHRLLRAQEVWHGNANMPDYNRVLALLPTRAANPPLYPSTEKPGVFDVIVVDAGHHVLSQVAAGVKAFRNVSEAILRHSCVDTVGLVWMTMSAFPPRTDPHAQHNCETRNPHRLACANAIALELIHKFQALGCRLDVVDYFGPTLAKLEQTTDMNHFGGFVLDVVVAMVWDTVRNRLRT